jgi:nitroreductase
MDAYLAVASKREVRRYDDRPLPDDAVRRVLEAGRIAGSSRNRQARRLVVLRDREAVAATVHMPSNVLGAALVVAIVTGRKGPAGFDAGRAAQNMMLAAWNEGVASCPNGIADADAAKAALDLDEPPVNILSFGYPARHPGAKSRSAEEWSARANRRPLDETVDRL